MEAKNFTVVLDGKPIFLIPMYPNTTIKQIKKYFENYLKKNKFESKAYNMDIYLDEKNKLDLSNPIYNKYSLQSVWDKITDGYIVLITDYFANLPKDMLHLLAQQMSLSDLLNFCQTNIKYRFLCEDTRDKGYWNRVVEEQYPNLTEFKNKVDKKLNWEQYYDYIIEWLETDWDRKLIEAVEKADIEGVKNSLDHNAIYNITSSIMKYAQSLDWINVEDIIVIEQLLEKTDEERMKKIINVDKEIDMRKLTKTIRQFLKNKPAFLRNVRKSMDKLTLDPIQFIAKIKYWAKQMRIYGININRDEITEERLYIR